jgi:hypothetical protein
MDQFKVLFGSSRHPGSHSCPDSMDDVHVCTDSSHGRSLVLLSIDGISFLFSPVAAF